ncbi:DUF547 domain-containing protein [Winogradskyella flava]|uniref:DUF547 domain-containing protein n=1 Tax=Winogradskyella flava TaxID=1884876 RepID=UPI0024932596|nr:DUF547 domain-containing protein [Winogradskyella flava]
MKSVLIFVLALFVSSCSGTKKAIGTQPEQKKEIAVVIETPKVSEIPESTSNHGEIKELIEVVDQNSNAIAEVESQEEVVKLIEKTTIQTDSIKFLGRSHFTFAHDNWDKLLQEHVSANGKVSYSGFKKNRNELNVYIKNLTDNIPIEESSKSEKLVFWINAYNALTIDLILRNYPLKSIKDIKDPWNQRLWQFGDKWMNLNDIEHKILRKMDEPRIHFAIVCASESCPKLKNEAFIASKLEAQLSNVTRAFLADTSKNEISENEIRLSKIFKWFKKDFEQNGSLIDFLNQYSEVTISNRAKKSFKDYNWNLNE